MNRFLRTALVASVLCTVLPATAQAYPHVYFQDAANWVTRDGNTWSPVAGTEWYGQHIADAAAWEIVVGVPTGSETDRCQGCSVMVSPARSFLPGSPITRAEFATLLARVIGQDRTQAPPSKFRDTPAGDWYQQYLGPLVQSNVIRLTDYYLDTFKPNEPITRREMAVWTGRAVTAYGIGVAPAELSRFADGADETDLDLRRSVALEIIKGKAQGDGSVVLDLAGQATRAEATTMLLRVVPRFNRAAPDVQQLADVVRDGFAAYARLAREVHDGYMQYGTGGKYVALNRSRFKEVLAPYFSDLAVEFIRDQRTRETGFLGDIEASSGWFKLAPSVLADLALWANGSDLTGMFVTNVTTVRMMDRFAEVEVQLVYDDTKFTGDIERWTQTRRVFLTKQNDRWVMTATAYVGSKRELIRK